MRPTVFAILAGFAASVPGPVAAQSGLAGRWVTEFDVGIRNVNGVETSEGKRQARITLEVSGDAITGSWQALGAGPTATRHLSGTSVHGEVTLLADSVEAVLRDGDGERHVSMIPKYLFTQHGDSLIGTLQTASRDGLFGGPPRRFVATREK